MSKRGEYLQVGMICCSTSLDHKDHSIWTAVIGWTAWALLMVEAEASDKPMYFIFPSSTNFLSSPIFHILKLKLNLRFKLWKCSIRKIINWWTDRDFNGNFGINSMLIIKINTIHSQSFQASFTSRPHIRRFAVDLKLSVQKLDPKFSSQLDLIPKPRLGL